MNLYDSNKATEEEVQFHYGIVWSDSSFGTSTSDYFDRCRTSPTNTTELDTLWDTRKLKHVILGQKLWGSFTSEFQIDIQRSRREYQIDGDTMGTTMALYLSQG